MAFLKITPKSGFWLKNHSATGNLRVFNRPPKYRSLNSICLSIHRTTAIWKWPFMRKLRFFAFLNYSCTAGENGILLKIFEILVHSMIKTTLYISKGTRCPNYLILMLKKSSFSLFFSFSVVRPYCTPKQWKLWTTSHTLNYE